MRAIQIDQFGDVEELKLRDVPVPQPGPNQVRIRMAYASVNPADWKARAGLLPHLNMFPFPMTLGYDGSGIVDMVGEGVTDFSIGDRVITLSGFALGLDGTYADYCCAPVPRVAPLPRGLSLAEGATIPIASASAASSILEVAGCKAGDIVLVNGGSGSVGTFAIQFLKYLGCRVAATCSARNLDYVRSLGADLVIDYVAQDIAESVRAWAPEGLNSVIDAVGQHSLSFRTPDLIRDGGVLVCIHNLLTGPEAFDQASAEARGIKILDNLMVMTPDPAWFQIKAFRQLLEAVQSGAIKPPPFKIAPLAEAGDAQAEVAEGHVRGKILLEIGGGDLS